MVLNIALMIAWKVKVVYTHIDFVIKLNELYSNCYLKNINTIHQNMYYLSIRSRKACRLCVESIGRYFS